MKNFWIILSAIVILLVGAFVATGGKEDSGGGGGTIENPRVVQENDHVKGAGNKGVTLIEYGDFECPGCGALYPVIKQIEEDFGDDIQFVFRHFPLVNIHPNAMAAHRAAQAAAQQGKFWEMHDLIYEQQSQWSSQVSSFPQAVTTFEGFAEQLELDVEQYKLDADSGEVFDYIDTHISSGNDLGFTGTPSLILNGEDFPTPRSYEELAASIQAAIDANEESGTTVENGEAADAKPEDEETPAVEEPATDATN